MSDPILRDHQRAHHCPFIPREEWGDPGPLIVVNGEPVCEPGDPCPGAYARTGAAAEAWRAFDWGEQFSGLGDLYPAGLPVVVAEAVTLCLDTKRRWVAEGSRRAEDARKRAV